MSVYRNRVQQVGSWLKNQEIDVALISDWEESRNSSLRYLCGLPGDANLLIFSDGKSILLPWDAILASKMAEADEVIPFGTYDRDLSVALNHLIPKEAKNIEVGAGSPYLGVEELREKLTDKKIVCRNNGLDDKLRNLRITKDENEIEAHRKAAKLTNLVLDELENGIKTKRFPLEVDVAMYIEAEGRKRGAEGTSFESIVAGPARSFGIHAFPSYGGSPFAAEGMSIVDFGYTVDGYASDVTLTVLSGTLTDRQEEMVDLVRNAYDLAVGMCGPGVHTSDIACAVDDLFAAHEYTMPHSLGHGIGLDVHEAPVLKNSKDKDTVLEAGMLVTIEPGLYDAEGGGVRYENDVLITTDGAEVITTSRLISLR